MASVQLQYKHTPGIHCESTAMRNLLAHVGLDLTEELCFGIGCGFGFSYVRRPGLSHFLVFGRGDSLELHLCDNLGYHLEIHKPELGTDSWSPVKAALDSGTPVLLDTNPQYLEHIRQSLSWPENTGFGGHKLVVVGYDESASEVYIHDYAWWDRIVISLPELQRARYTAGVSDPSARWFTVRRTVYPIDVACAIRAGLAATVFRMRSPYDKFHGLRAVQGFIEELPLWPQLLGPDFAQ